MKEVSKKIICTVTNDLIQDNRMIRICNTLSDMGHQVILVGRKRKISLPLEHKQFHQVRLHCFFEKGFSFYLVYNLRLTFFLFRNIGKNDIIYSVDTDTLLAGGVVKWMKRCRQIFDAHEYFTKVPELRDKSVVRFVWSAIENIFIPKADAHITVGDALAKLMSEKWAVSFTALYNVPYLESIKEAHLQNEVPVTNKVPVIIYVGMLNKGRGLEQMIKSMKHIPDAVLWIVGEGDITTELKKMAEESEACRNIIFKGWLNPNETKTLLEQATIGINLLDSSSESYYYSLANKFFDYMHAGLPSVNMDFPEYRHIINKYEVGITIDGLSEDNIAHAINSMLKNKEKLEHMHTECMKAKQFYNYELEAAKLSDLVMRIF
jgi:glycosyltransferase involved in cell wall biosynthesis